MAERSKRPIRILSPALVPAETDEKQRFWCEDELTFRLKDPDYQHNFPKGFYPTDAFKRKLIRLDAVSSTTDKPLE